MDKHISRHPETQHLLEDVVHYREYKILLQSDRFKTTIAIWRNRALEKSLSGEFAFQCKFERLDEVSKESLELSEEFYKRVQLDCGEWIKLGTTKTAMVYGLGDGGHLKNHE